LLCWSLGLFAVLPAGKLAIEDVKNDVPKDKRRGVSILPIIPLFPLLLWGITLGLNHWISDKIILIVILAHLLLILFCIFTLVRDFRNLHQIEKAKAAEQGAAANP